MVYISYCSVAGKNAVEEHPTNYVHLRTLILNSRIRRVGPQRGRRGGCRLLVFLSRLILVGLVDLAVPATQVHNSLSETAFARGHVKPNAERRAVANIGRRTVILALWNN